MNSELQNCQQTEPCTVEEIRNSLEQSEKGKVYNTAANYKRVLIGAVMWVESLVIANCWILLFAQACTALALYMAVNQLLHSVIQREVVAYLRGRSTF